MPSSVDRAWFPRQVSAGGGADFYLYIWSGHYPFAYSVFQFLTVANEGRSSQSFKRVKMVPKSATLKYPKNLF